MNIARESPGIVGADGKLFVVGGRLQDQEESKKGSVEIYSSDDSWKILSEDELHVRNANEEYAANILD